VLSTAFLKSTRFHKQTNKQTKKQHRDTQLVCFFQTLTIGGNDNPRVASLAFTCGGNFLPCHSLPCLGRYLAGFPLAMVGRYRWAGLSLAFSISESVLLTAFQVHIVWVHHSSHLPLMKRRGERGLQVASVPSHNAGLNILAHALVVMVIVRPTGWGVERRNAIEIEDKIFSVTHWSRMMLVTGQSHWKKKGEKKLQRQCHPADGGVYYF
jgi:hypothetical protein